MKRRESIKYKEVKTGSVKPVRGKRPMKRRGIGGREVFSRENYKDAFADMMEFNWVSILR